MTAEGTDETAWLDETEQAVWRHYISVMRLLPDRLNASLARGHDLTLIDYEVLARLSEAPLRRMRMTELAEGALLSKSRLSHQVSRMEKEGLVRREPCETDGRGFFAVLTDQGWEKLLSAAPAHVADVREVFITPLSRDQLVTLGEILDVIGKGLEPGRG
ncbi:MarR family transcriptional regulator [Catenulispora sp. NF23]|uniref:MarR family transcriptional regulator n=1 Tax=Catenulispora pinistramenti TaxID=2705254 RepID=A0ABS5KRT8_9ACTN|nr:MarR family transcriptional regulator [Catenulispora pinistramenti]MBS2532488.1 MarR family transcriptional regulator [Catenulispora pinistramenti]MBS2548749.1 MarR family transcriptional regulator [Catenulispora pinistramenti]